MQNIDSSVPDSLLSVSTQTLTMVTQIGLVLYLAPYIALAIPLLFLGYYVVYSRVRPAARYSSNSITMIVISNNSVNRDLPENCNRHRNTNRSGTRHIHNTPLLFLGYYVVYSRVRPAAR